MNTLLRNFFILLLSSLFLFGCAIFQGAGRPSDPVEALKYDIDEVLADSIFIPSRAGIKVISLDRGDVLYEQNSKMLMRPASNMKLLTSSTALVVLGKDYRFKTAIFADTIPTDGKLIGNLYFKGYGNPDLITSDLDTLVKQIKAAGIQEIQGNIFADISFFDDLFWGYGWNWDDEPYQYAAFLSPLTINDNCIRVKVTPGKVDSEAVEVTIDPPTSYVTLVNHGTTVADSARQPLHVTRLFKERLNTIVVDGEMKIGAKPFETLISVWRPELYAAQLLKEALERDSVQVWGTPARAVAPLQSKEVAMHYQRMDSMIVNLNKVSDNLSAELTLKTLSATKYGPPGSAEAGVYVVHEFLSSLGIDTTTFNVADGSGLSFYNLLTAEMLTELLQGMAKRSDLYPLFYESLPIAGKDGTLRNRMKGTPAEGNLRAKTGTISGVSSLSGYVHTLDGETLVFSMSMQNFIYPTSRYQRAQDRIGVLLSSFSRRGVKSITAP